jgi:hypothetical protein
MQICQEHWDMLRQARGIDHLIAKDVVAAVATVKAELAGDSTSYDPLMGCNWMIIIRALKEGGPYLLGEKADGTQYCPICEAVANGYPVEQWIDGPADAALKYCQEQRLVTVN